MIKPPPAAYIDCQQNMLRRAFVPHAVGFSPLAARALGGLAPLAAALCRQPCPARRTGPIRASGQAARPLPAPLCTADVPLQEAGAAPVAVAAEHAQPAPVHETDTPVPALLPLGGAAIAPESHQPETQPELSETMNPTDLISLRPQEDALSPSSESAGLLRYKKWWFLRHVDVHVGGELLGGTPIFVESGAMRLVNDRYSYFIPMEKIDYIRTCDGLDAGNAPAK